MRAQRGARRLLFFLIWLLPHTCTVQFLNRAAVLLLSVTESKKVLRVILLPLLSLSAWGFVCIEDYLGENSFRLGWADAQVLLWGWAHRFGVYATTILMYAVGVAKSSITVLICGRYALTATNVPNLHNVQRSTGIQETDNGACDDFPLSKSP